MAATHHVHHRMVARLRVGQESLDPRLVDLVCLTCCAGRDDVDMRGQAEVPQDSDDACAVAVLGDEILVPHLVRGQTELRREPDPPPLTLEQELDEGREELVPVLGLSGRGWRLAVRDDPHAVLSSAGPRDGLTDDVTTDEMDDAEVRKHSMEDVCSATHPRELVHFPESPDGPHDVVPHHLRSEAAVRGRAEPI